MTGQDLVPTRLILVRQPRTLRECIPRFLQWFAVVRGRRPNTVAAYSFDLRTFVEFCDEAGLERPEDVTFRQIEVYLGWLRQERGHAETTANRHLNTLRTFWRFLMREGVAAANPALDCFSFKKPERLPRYLTIPEQERVLFQLAQDRSLLGRRDYALVALMLLTGLRVEEVTRLRVTDLDLEEGKVRVEESKGKKGRELPVVPRLAAILGDYLHAVRLRLVQRPRGYLHRDGQDRWEAQWFEDGRMRRARLRAASEADARRHLEALAPLPPEPPWLFVNASPSQSHRLHRAGEPLLTRSVFHIIRRQVAPRVGRQVSPHTLRHSFASRLREAGAPLELIGDALGHAQLTTTMIYAHLSTAKRKMDLTRFLEAEA